MNITEVTGHPGGECYLIQHRDGGVLWDAGFGFCAARTAENIAARLRGQPLLGILLSHSHYDHAMGCPGIKRVFPEARVVCSGPAAAIFQRDGAVKVMGELDGAAAADDGFPPAQPERVAPDAVLEDREMSLLGGLSVQGLLTPGHTRCSMSYWFPELGLLAASESTGAAPCYPEVLPTFLNSYRASLDSLALCGGLGAERLLLPHTGLIEGAEAVADYFSRAGKAAAEAAEFVLEQRRKGGGVEEIVAAYRRAYYREEYADRQPERAFLLNARAMVPRLLQEMGMEA